MSKLKLKYCANCIQMTNHLNGVCQKCKKNKEMISINNINENCNSNENYSDEDDYAYKSG